MKKKTTYSSFDAAEYLDNEEVIASVMKGLKVKIEVVGRRSNPSLRVVKLKSQFKKLPQITNGNLNAPTPLIGEKASDHILGKGMLAPEIYLTLPPQGEGAQRADGGHCTAMVFDPISNHGLYAQPNSQACPQASPQSNRSRKTPLGLCA